MINWAINIRYAWERKVFLETEWDLRTAIFNWVKMAAKNISVYQDDKPELSPVDANDLRILEKVMAGMTSAVVNGYVLDFCEELDSDEVHIAAREKAVACGE